MEITKDIAEKVLTAVDAGLVYGIGNPVPGSMCVEAAVCYAMGLPHSDKPICVAPALRTFKIRLNDSSWSSRRARAQGMRRLALVQLGSAGVLDEKEFARRLAGLAVRKIVSRALRVAAKVHPSTEHRAKLEEAAVRCGNGGVADADAVHAARSAADAARSAAAAADAADAARSAASAAAFAVHAARSAVHAAAAFAANAADEGLSWAAEEVVQILVDMGVPGAQWLYLTEDR